METIYQRGDESTNPSGGADFHVARPNLIPEWIIQATRKPQEIAKTTEELIQVVDETHGDNVVSLFPDKKNKVPLSEPERLRRVVEASGTLSHLNRKGHIIEVNSEVPAEEAA